MSGRRRTRLWLLAAVAGVTIVVAVLGRGAHVMRSLELKSVDARFALRGTTGAPADVAVVQIDDATFDDLRNGGRASQWPLPRCYHASVINQIAKARPSAIAVDIQFSAPTTATSRNGVSCDKLLVEAIARAGHVVLATTIVDEQGRSPIFGGDAVMKQIGARPANGVMPADPDGVLRRVPYEFDKLKSFAV